MMSYLRSFSFITSLTTGGGKNCMAVDYPVTVGDETIATVFFGRRGRRNGSTVLAVNGLSVHGVKDPRMISLCRALSSCGFNVILPAYSDIGNFIIRSETVDTIAESIEAITADRWICPDGMLSIIAPSFSGGLAILAALKPGVSGRIKSVCTIGTFARVKTALEFLLGRQDNDEYGRMIIMKNYAHLYTGRRPGLERAFELAYLDNGFCREVPELDAHLESMAAEDVDIFSRLRTDAAARMEMWRSIMENSPAMKKLVFDMDAYERIHLLKAPITFIHGSGDNVIDPSESENLHNRMKELGLKSRLVVTPLISHGDYRLSLSLIREIVKLLDGFAFFMRHASAKKSRGSRTEANKGGGLFAGKVHCADASL